jgi:hypothetical protein
MTYAPALSAALWLALAGAALPQSVTPAAILECKAPRETAATAFDKGFPITKSIDRSVAPDLDITHIYKLPGYTVFDHPVSGLGASHVRTPAKDSMMFMSIFDTPYLEMRGAAMKAQGLVNCLAELSGRCLVMHVEADGWKQTGILEDRDGTSSFTCTYERVAKKD